MIGIVSVLFPLKHKFSTFPVLLFVYPHQIERMFRFSGQFPPAPFSTLSLIVNLLFPPPSLFPCLRFPPAVHQIPRMFFPAGRGFWNPLQKMQGRGKKMVLGCFSFFFPPSLPTILSFQGTETGDFRGAASLFGLLFSP